MIVKGARKPSASGLWQTSTLFRVLTCSLPFTLLVLISHFFAFSISVVVAPFVLLWKIFLLFIFVRRRNALAQLDPLTMRERSDTNKKFHFLWTWWNYLILVILITAYCGVISFNVAGGIKLTPGAIAQVAVVAIDIISLATLIFVIARTQKRSRAEARLRTKALEAGEIESRRDSFASASDDVDTVDYGETINGDASTTLSVDTPPPAYSNNGRAPPQVVCMMCATHISPSEKVLIQPSLR